MTFSPSCVQAQAQAHVPRINLVITSQKKKTTSARSRKSRGQDLRETKKRRAKTNMTVSMPLLKASREACFPARGKI